MQLDANGRAVFPCGADCDDVGFLGVPLYMQALSVTNSTGEVCTSNPNGS